MPGASDSSVCLYEAIIALWKSDLPEEWSRYCELAESAKSERPPEEVAQARLKKRNLNLMGRTWERVGGPSHEMWRLERTAVEHFIEAGRSARFVASGRIIDTDTENND